MSNPLDNFASGPLRHRAVNNNPFQSSNPYHEAGTFASYLSETKNYSLQWLFMNYKKSAIFNELLKDLPIDLIIRTMNRLAHPVYANFMETNEEPTFLEISGDFYRELFWLGELYCSKDFFTDRESYEIEGDDEPEEIEALAELGGIDLWIKLTGDRLDRDIKFMHITTGITVKIPGWRKKLIYCNWNASGRGRKPVNNFIDWFEHTVDYLMKLRQLDNFKNVMVKRIMIQTKDSSYATTVDKIKADLNTSESVLTSNLKDFSELRPVKYGDGNELSALHFTTFNELDRKIYELGRVSNTNPKGDRLSSGENYKDITSVANRQKTVLEQLKLFASKVSDMWGLDLNFVVSGIPEKQALDTDDHKAPTPNSSDQLGGSGMGSK